MDDPQHETRHHSIWPLLLATGLALVVATILVLLSLGFFGLVLGISAAVCALAALHYLTWGWWLGRMIEEEAEQDDNG